MSFFKRTLLGALLFVGLLAAGSTTSVRAETVERLANVGNPVGLSGPEQRVALVIGNSNYQNVSQLPNPAGDAKAVAQMLNDAGFEVISATDLDHNQMIQVIQDFSGKIAGRGPNTVAMVYYAGHGVQLAGENYLVPVDARISSEPDLVKGSVRLVDVMATLEAIPSRMRIVILDACRNNPFPTLSDAGRGLAIVDAPNGSIVGYSTAPGTEALDGAGDHSPYANAFLRLAHEKNLPIEQLFKRVRLDVNNQTNGQQTPWESSSLTSDFYFFGDTAVAATRAPVSAQPSFAADNLPSRAARQAYDYVLAENSIDNYQEYIRLYPHDPLCDRIRALLANLVQAKAWHTAVLANSPVAYKFFYEKFSGSPYAQTALKLETQPKQFLAPTSIKFGGPGNGGFGNTANGNPGLDKLGHGGQIVTLQSPGANAVSGNHGTGKIVDLPNGGLNKAGTPQNSKLNGEASHVGDRQEKTVSHLDQPRLGKSRSNFGTSQRFRGGSGFGNGGRNFHMASSRGGFGGGGGGFGGGGFGRR
jgi:uncharacterized membrane protein YgcG